MSSNINPREFILDEALSSRELKLLRQVSDTAAEKHVALYLVGGCVRDLLLKYPAVDFDLVVEGDAIAFAAVLSGRYGGRVTSHARFGTAQWYVPSAGQKPLDLISTRSESYKHPAALPSVKRGTLLDDLSRRDFTINTLAIRLDGEHWGEIHDEMGGLEDLRQGELKVLHPGSFRDDPTRLFRLIRYEQRYCLTISPGTQILIPDALPLIKSLSSERLRHELDLILAEDTAADILSHLSELGMLNYVHPVIPWNESVRLRLVKGRNRMLEKLDTTIPSYSGKAFLAWHFWLMGLSADDLRSVEDRLHFHANLFRSLLAASALYTDLITLEEMQKPSQLVVRLDNLPVTAVYAVFLAGPQGKMQMKLKKYLEVWKNLRPVTNGHTLKELGLSPGPRFQEIISRLRQAWLDGEVRSETEEKNLLNELIAG